MYRGRENSWLLNMIHGPVCKRFFPSVSLTVRIFRLSFFLSSWMCRVERRERPLFYALGSITSYFRVNDNEYLQLSAEI